MDAPQTPPATRQPSAPTVAPLAVAAHVGVVPALAAKLPTLGRLATVPEQPVDDVSRGHDAEADHQCG